MADLIRVGIVGASVTEGRSGWGSGAHVPALKAVPGYQLKAVCTSQEATARASAEKFGAELAFHDFNAMIARDDIDLVSVVVRVPQHHALVMKALDAGKMVYCEWPLGNGLKEGVELADRARSKKLITMCGMQARSDPTIRYARELVAQGHVGEVLMAQLKVIAGTQLARGHGRIWQGIRANGANPLTIPGGHSMDAMRYIIGDFAEVSARLATRVKQWKNSDNGETLNVDAPDSISAVGRMVNDAEISIHIGTAPTAPGGFRLEIYGTRGTLVITSSSVNLGINKLFGAQGKAALEEMPVPGHFSSAPADTPAGPPRNVAHAYARFAQALKAGTPVDPDFDAAVGVHKIIDAIERSAAERKAVNI